MLGRWILDVAKGDMKQKRLRTTDSGDGDYILFHVFKVIHVIVNNKYFQIKHCVSTWVH